MEILSALGVNSTIWLQFVCFIVSYLALSQLVFKPYMAALQERAKRTVGNEEYAGRLVEEALSLQTQYEARARDLNQQTKAIYDQTRQEAVREQDRLISEAREQASSLLDKNRSQIAKEVGAAKEELSRQAPAVGLAIASKLVGKELAQ